MIDALAPLGDGQPMRRHGRYFRFFQYLSLFCFSMLGLVVAGNVAMVFMFWELVGICSYLLIGFWRERQSASNAANKAFIVNRVGDFGMIVGLMVIWTGMGTFSFADYKVTGPDGKMVTTPGIFSQVRPAENDYQLQVPDGMVKWPHIGKSEDCSKVWQDSNSSQSTKRTRTFIDGVYPAAYDHIDPKRSRRSGDRKATATGSWSSPAWAFSAAAWARARSSRCTFGCRTRWKAPRR